MHTYLILQNAIFDTLKITQRSNKILIGIALGSFLIGTILFGIFMISKYDLLVGIGLCYVLLAALINSFCLLKVLFDTVIDTYYWQENLITICIITLNIPIAFSYFYILFGTV